MKEELIKIAEELHKYKFRNGEKVLVPIPVMVKALENAFKKGEESMEKIVEEALTTARVKANSQIKDEQSIAHTHTAINQIDDEIFKKGDKDGTS